MIESPVERLIRRLARLEAFQLIKNQPELAESLWNKANIEDAEFTTVPARRPRNRKPTVAIHQKLLDDSK